MWQENDGNSVMRMFADGIFKAPYQHLLPVEFVTVDEGHIVITLPSSEWFCRYSRSVAFGSITSLATRASGYASLTIPRRSQSFVGFDHTTRLYRPVPADGRPLRAEARAELRDRRFVVVDVRVHDADGQLVSSAHGLGVVVDNAKRQRRSLPEAKRILATLLFTDVVGSTEHAERLGDARWRALVKQTTPAGARAS
jgi:acyl-coenzyme A thioesterase PaaI-like protein